MAPFGNHELGLDLWIGFTQTRNPFDAAATAGDTSCASVGASRDASEGSLPLAGRAAPHLRRRVGRSLRSRSTAAAIRGQRGAHLQDSPLPSFISSSGSLSLPHPDNGCVTPSKSWRSTVTRTKRKRTSRPTSTPVVEGVDLNTKAPEVVQV
ncbi:hypothetical protein GQ55_5G285800 [Panicum hallii var. hallii]|uniref:Uncharacterized protein n=1 Tax=Panicum hallii var. hallii TaxID=1504633 RepID=A0A2T7DL63_9POAL|nr:hypothetical protein GQ55_5G285800 [Panicum hallii var. hallii]